MRGWTFMLGGLIVWAVHFFSLYAVASVLLSSTLARVLTLLFTLACLSANALLFAHAWRWPPPDPPAAWTRSIALLAAVLSAVAVLWQGAPALLG